MNAAPVTARSSTPSSPLDGHRSSPGDVSHAPMEASWHHAWLLLARDRGQEATRGFLDCFSLARRLGDQFNVGEALAGLSTQAAREGRWEHAAVLAGASAAMHEDICARPWESVSDMQERALAQARDALGVALYGERFAEGRRLCPDAVTLAQSATPALLSSSSR